MHVNLADALIKPVWYDAADTRDAEGRRPGIELLNDDCSSSCADLLGESVENLEFAGTKTWITTLNQIRVERLVLPGSLVL